MERGSRRTDNKSLNARAAEARGERVWTRWRLQDLIEQVLRVNERGLTATDLRRVRSLELLKVTLLTRSEPHHVHLLQDSEIQSEQVQYYKLHVERARKLTAVQLRRLSDDPPTPEELDERVVNLTDHNYYRPPSRARTVPPAW